MLVQVWLRPPDLPRNKSGRSVRRREWPWNLAFPTSVIFGNVLLILIARAARFSQVIMYCNDSPRMLLTLVEFSRMITMVESRYYRKLFPENFVHHKSEQKLKLRKELGEFEQRYKTWIIWTIVTSEAPGDPVERACVIEFWFEVPKVHEIRLFVSFV